MSVAYDKSDEKYNEGIMINARYSQLEMEVNIGKLSEESIRVERASINYFLLSLIDSIDID